MSPHNRRCFQNHLGVYACEPRWFQGMTAAIKAGTAPVRKGWDDDDSAPRPPTPWVAALAAQPVCDTDGSLMYYLTGDGVAIIEVNGPLMKAESKFGGTSTVALRRSLRMAESDTRVIAIMMHTDSPGGHVSGTAELADEVARVDQVKPVATHIDDLGASAAYWPATASRRITANAMAEVGSIGVYTVIYDTSKAYEMEGWEAHVIGSGGMKGAFVDGTKVTAEQIAYEQGLVDNVNGFFTAAVKKNRGMTDAQVARVAVGKVWPAAEAKTLKLIDDVSTFEDAVSAIAKEGRAAKRASKREQAQASIALAESDG